MTAFRQVGYFAMSTYGPLGVGMIQAANGDIQAGLQHLRDAVALAESAGFTFGLHRAQREAAEVELTLGEFTAARARLEPFVTAPDCETYNDITPMLPLLAWALLEAGEVAQAEILLERAAPQAVKQHHMLALLDVLRVRGMLCTRQGRWAEAQAALEDGLARARGRHIPMPR